MATAITEVRLLNVPLDKNYIHTLYFATQEEQLSYFSSKAAADRRYTNLSYQRKDSFIRIPEQFDSILKCNYVMYKNAAYSSKWHYAFITDMKYVDDGRTDVYIETDVIQTWLFDYNVKQCFVEREHTLSDSIGIHTVPERVELGEYVCNKHNKAGYAESSKLVIVVGTTKTPDGENVPGDLYDNIYSGVKYYTFRNTVEGAKQLQDWLGTFAKDGAAEAITCMFLVPEKLTVLKDNHETTATNYVNSWYINSGDPESTINTELTISTNKLDGYTPKNKKLLTYPYRYLLVSNNAGAAVPFQYEQFSSQKPKFKIEGALCPGGSVRMIPLNYKGEARFDEEAINLGKFPCLNWTSDVYTNWLTQNGVNVALSLAGSALTIAGGIGMIASGAGAIAGAGAVASGILGVGNAVGEVYSRSMVPPQSQGNLNSGDVVTATGDNDFHFYDMTIKAEYAAIIDNYFSMYGYKVNRVKTPAKAHRANYWYTKTIDANIIGNVPIADLQKIKDCYNKGITFWSNPANFGNYSVENEPI